MQLKKYLLLLCFLCVISAYSQVPELSPLSKISVLTSGPGQELYSSFGHSAFRVQDPSLGIDVVYNYGVFDTSGENFYWKFSQGRMDYRLVRNSFQPYLNSYKSENRWVREQDLNLSLQERRQLFKFLENNNLPQNSVYQYDYFLNNCATKIWDVLKENFGDQLVFDEDYIQEKYSFRDMIRQHIKDNSWGAFGIDLALGAVIDRKATPKEHLFLPLYVLRQINAAKINGTPLATKEKSLFEAVPKPEELNFFTTPLFIFLILMLIVLSFTFIDHKHKKRTKKLDFALFFVTGTTGCLIFFLWFITDHVWTVDNFNILWAFPVNVMAAFIVLRSDVWPVWLRYYLLFLLGLLVVTILLWTLHIQYFSPANIPLLVMLAGRYYYLYRYSSEKQGKYRINP